jgi:hypothetical protein
LHIIRAGGISEVYCVDNSTLKRKMVLKVLPAGLPARRETRRAGFAMRETNGDKPPSWNQEEPDE